MKCPVCDKGNASLKIQKKKRQFRKEEFEFFEFYYQCENCNEEFTTTETDTINTNQVYNQYREKHSIPFPEQLNSLREYYNISAAKMSELLGFGTNQYRLYENGEFPSGGNATVLSLIINPSNFKNIIIKNKSILSKKKFDEVIDKIEYTITDNLDKLLEKSLFPSDIIPNRFTGFTLPRFRKFANMVLYFLVNAPFKVRLNKLLFYADFTSYKYSGFSISGCRYAAIDMGSVPDQYSHIYGLLESEKYITAELVKVKDKEYDKFVSLRQFDKSLFTDFELSILNDVLNKFRHISTNELMEISHNEKAWQDNNKSKSIIDYVLYAPQLTAL